MANVINRVGKGSGGSGATANIYITGLSETDTVTMVSPSGKSISGEWTAITERTAQSIPTLTATTSDILYYNGNYSGYDPYKAFDDDSSTAWMSNTYTSGSGLYLGYKFSTPIYVTSVYRKSGTATHDYWKVQYSDDGETWTDSGYSFENSNENEVTGEISVSTPHQYWRIYQTKADAVNRFTTTTLQFYGYSETSTPCWLFHASEYGTHTVTATNGTNTSTEEVLVDALADYYIAMSYLPSGCIAEYLFDDYTDTSGSDYHLTNSGTSLTDCSLENISKCLYLNGSSYAYDDDLKSKFSNTPFSIAFWCKTSSTSRDTSWFINTRTNGRGFNICPTTTEVRGDWYGGSSWVYDAPFTAFTHDASTNWNFYVVTFTNTTESNGLKLYFNASILGQRTAGTTYTADHQFFRIGYNGSAYATGYLASLRIYNKVLSTDEIALLYNNGKGV